MAFDAYDRTLQLLRASAPLFKLLATRDPDLAKQMRRAGSSILLNISEASRRAGKDRGHLFRMALGSAAEVGAGLELGVALEYLGEAEAAPALELVDRVRAMTYRLANR